MQINDRESVFGNWGDLDHGRSVAAVAIESVQRTLGTLEILTLPHKDLAILKE